jgi:hypothetical protein
MLYAPFDRAGRHDRYDDAVASKTSISKRARDLVSIEHVRVVQRTSAGLVCGLDGREFFLSYSELGDSPPRPFVEGQIITVVLRPSFAEEVRILVGERRSEARLPVAPREALWLFCPARGIGGQAELRDVSRTGVRIALDRRHGWRLARALRHAGASAALVEVARLPNNRHRQARVRWAVECATNEMEFGLKLTEPLHEWTM